MRTNRRFTAILLSLVMAFSLLPAPAAATGCEHRADDSSNNITSTLSEVAVSSTYDCTKSTVIKAYYTCSGCSEEFSDYESTADGTDNKITDDSTYIQAAAGSHTFQSADKTGKCTSTVTIGGETLNCSGTCDHDGETAGSECSKCGATVPGGGTEPDTCTNATTEGTCKATTHNNGCIEACTGQEGCPATGAHKTGCPAASSDPDTCTNATTEGTCKAETHNNGCIEACTKANDCPATGTHKTGCPKASTDPGDEETPAALVVEDYDYKTGNLKVTYRGSGQETAYAVSLYKGAHASLPDGATPVETKNVEMTPDSAEGSTTYTGKYIPEVELEAGATYCIEVANGAQAGFKDFTVDAAGTDTPTTPGEKDPDAMEGVDNTTTAEESVAKVESLLGITESTEAQQKEAVLAITDTEVDKIVAANTARNVTVNQTGSITVPRATLALLGAAAAPNSTVALEVKNDGTQRDTPTTAAKSQTFSIVLMVNSAITHDAAIFIPLELPVPSSFGEGTITIIHYGTRTETITPEISGSGSHRVARFATNNFSDFQMVEAKSGTSNPTDPTNPGTPSTPGSSNTPHKGGSSGGGSSAKPATSTTPTTPNNGGTTVTTTPTQVFKDIPANHWASAQIKWAYDNKCMNGTGDGAFTPNGTVTRQALWMVLARLAGSNPADMAAAKAWAVENSISDGTTPSGAVSRQQLVTILYRFAQMMAKDTQGAAELSSYPDAASVASYAQDALAWAVGNGIVSGTSDGRLNPEGSATRAQFAVILYRFYNGEQAQ